MENSIIRQFNRTVVLTVVFYIALTVVLYVFVVEGNTRRLREEVLKSNAKEVSSMIDEVLEEEIVALSRISEHEEVLTWMKEGDEAVFGIDEISRYMSLLNSEYFYIVSNKSGAYYYTNKEESKFSELKLLQIMSKEPDDQWFYETLNKEFAGSYYTYDINVERDYLNNGLVIWINYVIIDEGEKIGIIGCSMDAETIINELVEMSIAHEDTYVIDEYGAIQLAYNKDLIKFDSFGVEENSQYLLSGLVSDKSVPKKLESFKASLNKSLQVIPINDATYESIVVAKIPKINWSVAVLYRGDSVLNINALIITLIILIAGLYAFIVIYIWFIKAKVVVPITLINTQMDDFMSKNKIEELDIEDNELGRLGKKIVNMEKELKASNDDMSLKVIEKEDEIHGLYSHIKTSEARTQRFLDSLPIPVIRFDKDLDMLYCNQIGLSLFEIKGVRDYREKRIRNMFYPFESNESYQQFKVDLNNNCSLIDYRVTFRINNFKTKIVLMNLYPTEIDHIIYYEGIIRDITKGFNYEKQLLKRANYDSLTNVFSRDGFLKKIKDFTKVIGLDSSVLYFVTLDFDFFKKINDENGHLAGDLVLKRTIKIVKYMIEDIGVIGRIGGDEFAMLIKVNDENQVHNLMNELHKKVEDNIINYEHKILKVTLSSGYTRIEADDDFKKMYYRSDQALYHAKEIGKNRTVNFEEIKEVRSKDD